MDTRFFIAFLVLATVLFLIKRAGQISPRQTADLLAQGALIIDVRSPDEFASGHLPNAINLPLGDIQNRIVQHAPNKDQPLLLHCLSGTRSGMAKSQLKKLGYTNAHNLGSYNRARSLVDTKSPP
jgi:phage shock protein E